MRPRPQIATRLASLSLAALGLMLPSRSEAASMMSAVDLGAGVSGLVLGESGQVAGFPANSSNPYYNPYTYSLSHTSTFEYDNGQFTNLNSGATPLAVAGDGRVFTATGPYSTSTGWGGDANTTFFVDSAPTAANHLGELAGTVTTYPGAQNPGGRPYFIFESPYIYVPDPPGVKVTDLTQTSAPNPGFPYAGGRGQNPDGSVAPGTMFYSQPYPSIYLGSSTHPTGINDHGLVVGDVYSSDDQAFAGPGAPIKPKPNPAYIHAASDGYDLGTLGGLNSHAAAVNNSGLVVGSSDTAGGASHAFLFTPAGPLAQGVPNWHVYGITDAPTPGIGTMVDLGVLPGMTASAALGINDRGQVVGWSSRGAISDAFLFSNGIMEDLNDRLPATLGIHLDQATAINDAGQIVAYGHGSDGVEHGYLLSATPTPEPTALALMILAGVGFGVRRLRFSKGKG